MRKERKKLLKKDRAIKGNYRQYLFLVLYFNFIFQFIHSEFNSSKIQGRFE